MFYTGVRFLLAAGILLAFFFRRMIKIPGSTLRKGAVLGILVFGGFTVQTVGLQYTTASKSAFFTGLLVVLTPIMYYFLQPVLKLERKSLRIGNLVGVLSAATGLYLLTSPTGSGFNKGDALTLVCAPLFAFYIVYLDFASVEPDKVQLTFVQFVLCGVLGFLSAVFFENIRIDYTSQSLFSLLYLTVFATVISMWVQNRFQGDTTPTRAAVIFSMEPVVAGILAYMVRGEILGTAGIAGAGIIVGGVLVSEFSDEIPLLNKPVKLG